MAKIRNFSDFMNEASFQGNVGIPGEEGENRPSYLKRTEQEANQRNQDFMRQNGREISQFMSLVGQARRLQAGKEAQLEELAEATVRELFGSILDGVTLNIKFPKSSSEIPKMMEESPDAPEMPELEELKDAEIISAIQVRKIANAMMQGEAKNTKLCLNLDSTFEGLVEIFGEEDAEKMRDLLTKITTIANFFDWNIPMEVQKEMWKQRDGFSGSVQVEWENSNEETEDLAKKLLGDLENGDDLVENTDAEELFNETTPTVNALGTDFAMLLHEGVKGVYMLIAALSIPQDEEVAGIVVGNTDSLADEIEDLRYGPKMAQDFNDFVNELDTSRITDNPRARLFGKLLEIADEDRPKFLRIFNSILLSRFGADELNDSEKDEVTKVTNFCQKLIEMIADELDSFYSDQQQSEYYEEEPEDTFTPTSTDPAAETKQELLQMLDAALDAGDEAEFKRISKKLNDLGESRSYVFGFSNFITESVDAGKKYVIRLAIEKKIAREFPKISEEDFEEKVKDAIKQITPEVEREILAKDQDFNEIKKMLEKNPGLMVPFLRFRKEEGASLDQLAQQLTRYTGLNQLSSKVSAEEYTNIPKYILIKVSAARNKKSVSSKAFEFIYLTDVSEGASVFQVKEVANGQTPSLNKKNEFLEDAMKLVASDGAEVTFIKVKEVNPEIEQLIANASTAQHIPGYERFGDKVSHIQRLREGDWIRKSLPTTAGRLFGKSVNLKKEFEDSPEDFKEKMLKDAAIITDANDPDIIRIFNKKLSSLISIEEVREYLDKKIAALGKDSESLLKQVEELSPGVECMYDDERYVLISVRSDDAQKKLCSAAAWCINNGSFWNYATGRLQFAVFDFSKPQSDVNYMLGFTCEYNGTVYAAHDTEDRSVKSGNEDYKQLLARRGYPANMINDLEKMFKIESEIKKVTDVIYKNGSSSEDRIISILNNSVKQYVSALGSEEDMKQFSIVSKMALRVIVDDFLREQLSDKSLNALLEAFKDKGILIDQAYLIFKAIFPNPTYDQLNAVIAATKRYLERIKDLLKQLNKGRLEGKAKDQQMRVQELYTYTTATVLPKLEQELSKIK